jgi:hypothetical protein
MRCEFSDVWAHRDAYQIVCRGGYLMGRISTYLQVSLDGYFAGPAEFELTKSRSFKNGLVWLTYQASAAMNPSESSRLSVS